MSRDLETAKRTAQLSVQGSSCPKIGIVLYPADKIKNINFIKFRATHKKRQAVFSEMSFN